MSVNARRVGHECVGSNPASHRIAVGCPRIGLAAHLAPTPLPWASGPRTATDGETADPHQDNRAIRAVRFSPICRTGRWLTPYSATICRRLGAGQQMGVQSPGDGWIRMSGAGRCCGDGHAQPQGLGDMNVSEVVIGHVRVADAFPQRIHRAREARRIDELPELVGEHQVVVLVNLLVLLFVIGLSLLVRTQHVCSDRRQSDRASPAFCFRRVHHQPGGTAAKGSLDADFAFVQIHVVPGEGEEFTSWPSPPSQFRTGRNCGLTTCWKG